MARVRETRMRFAAAALTVMLTIAAPTLAGEVVAPSGEAGIAFAGNEVIVAVDASNEGRESDGLVDHVFRFSRSERGDKSKTPTARLRRLAGVTVEFFGDAMVLTAPESEYALELVMKGSPIGPRQYPERWRVERYADGYGLAHLADLSGSMRLWRGGTKRDDSLRRRSDDWADDEQDWSGLGGGGVGGRPGCQAGGRGATSCTITCGMNPVLQTATITCGGASYACCWCDYQRAYATCVAYGP